MPDLAQIEWIDGAVYDIVDPIARQQSAGAGNAIVNITRSGNTFTATRADGTTFTFTQKDDDTHYSAGNGLALNGTTFSNAAITTLQRIERNSADVTLAGNSSTDVVFAINAPTGYTYLAVAGIEIRNALDGGQGESHVASGEFHTSDGLTNFHVYLHNTSSSQAKVYVVCQFVVVNNGSLV